MNDLGASAAELLRHAESLLQQRRLVEAAQAFRTAEQAGADANDCAGNRWLAAMLQGDFVAAWHESDTLRLRGAPDPHRFWNGEDITGKRLIVRCLHGLGDSVQMLRYLPLLQARCRSVVVEVPPRLLPLAPYFTGMRTAITWGADAPDVAPVWDVQVEVMELPYLFRTTAPELPLARHYLSPPPAVLQQVARNMGTTRAPRVGLVWSASEWDRTRCLPLACVERLLAVLGVEWWNLQGGEQHTVGQQSAAIRSMRDAADLGDGLLPLAAAIAHLDLVVTVDTLAAHLAGAMGKPAWVLLQARANWRWMQGRSDSPWYPTLQLWQQPMQDDWASLTADVCTALAAWAAPRSTDAA